MAGREGALEPTGSGCVLPSRGSTPHVGLADPARVFLLIETCFYRDGLLRALARAPALTVVGQAASWRDGVALVRERRPDVILLDVPASDRVDAVRAITVALPAARIVALSVADATDAVLPLAEAGIAGFVTPAQSLDELVDVVETVTRGELRCSPLVAGGLLRRVTALAGARGVARGERDLAREREIVELIGYGLSNRQIGEHLVIELSTVKNHIHNILEKLHVDRRADAVAYIRGSAGSRSGPPRTDPRIHFVRSRRSEESAERVGQHPWNRSES